MIKNAKLLLFVAALFAAFGVSAGVGIVKGTVWNDLNANGLQDGGEMGMSSVWIQLETPTGGWVNGGYTNMDGTYQFNNVQEGSYRMKFANPANGFNQSPKDVGTNDAIDSDADLYGFTSVFTLAANQTVDMDGGFNTQGACYTPVNATVGTAVCNDNGTPTNPGDDTYTFTITATGGTSFGGQSWGWDWTAGGLSMIPYGTPRQMGPFPISGGSKTITISDHDNPFCTTTVTVNAPAPCSGGGGSTLNMTCTNNITVTAPSGANSAVVNYNAPATSTTCAGGAVNVTRTSGLASGSAFPVGTTQVCYQATDNCGNVKTCCFTVTVNAGSTPTLTLNTCPVDMSITAASGSNGATVYYNTPTATTTCSGGAVNITRTSGLASGSFFPIGTTQVCHQATDNCGNVKTCCFNVTVNAGSTPTLTMTFCTGDMSTTLPAGSTGTTMNYVTPTATTTCAGGTVNMTRISGPASGSFFPVGTTQVCYQATDNCGNVKTCCFNVTINVSTPSALTMTFCTGDLSTTLPAGSTGTNMNYATPTATTTCAGGTVNMTRISGPASGSFFPVGTTQVCYQATDNCGNVKTCCFNVTINVATATTLTINNCPVNMNVTATAGTNGAVVTYPTPTATTTCSGGAVNIVRTTGLASGSVFPVGTTQVCHQATDNCGNVKTCCFNVVVTASQPTCTPVSIVEWNLDACSASNTYEEFTPSFPNGYAGNNSLTATNWSRINGGHSCSPSRNGIGKAACVPPSTTCSFVDNDDYATRFSVTVTPQSGSSFKMTQLSFWENSPVNFSQIGGNTGLNDYATRYGLRILKNGVQIFKQVDIVSEQQWNQEIFDFTNNPAFEVTTTTTFSFELRAYCRVGNGSTTSVWDMDDVKIMGCSGTGGGSNLCNKNVLFVVGSTTLGTGDTWVKSRLQSLGLTVTVVDQFTANASYAAGKGLVVISSTVLSDNINSKFTNVAIPVMTWEQNIYDDLKMTGPTYGTDYGTMDMQCLNIANPSHPLACGYSGNINIYPHLKTIPCGVPNNNAIKVAQFCNAYGEWGIFAYEQGASMVGMTAPARRLGFPMNDNTAPYLTLEGRKLFDCAIKWLLPNCTLNNLAVAVATPELTFNAYRNGNDVDLKWISTTGEINDYFMVMHSTDGDNWTSIGKVDGKGAAGEYLYLDFTDEHPARGDNFYQLRAVRMDGSNDFSDIKIINLPNPGDFGIYPNPADAHVYIDVQAFAGQPVSVQLFDQYGRAIKAASLDVVTEEPIDFNLDGVENGAYIVKMESKGVIRTQKLVVAKPY